MQSHENKRLSKHNFKPETSKHTGTGFLICIASSFKLIDSLKYGKTFVKRDKYFSLPIVESNFVFFQQKYFFGLVILHGKMGYIASNQFYLMHLPWEEATQFFCKSYKDQRYALNSLRSMQSHAKCTMIVSQYRNYQTTVQKIRDILISIVEIINLFVQKIFYSRGRCCSLKQQSKLVCLGKTVLEILLNFRIIAFMWAIPI